MNPMLECKTHHGILHLNNVFVYLEGGKYREFPKVASRNRSGFLNSGTINILDQRVFLFSGAVLSIAGCLAASLVSTHW